TIVALDSEENAVEIVARDVRLIDRQGHDIASMPEVEITLSLDAAMRFMLAPTRVVARKPELRLQRDEDGSFRLLDDTGAGSTESLRVFLEELAHPPDRSRPSGYLAEVALAGGSVAVEDRRLGRTWTAEDVDSLAGAFVYQTDSHRLVASLGAEGIRPASLAGLAPALAPLETLEASIGGRARLTVDVDRARVERSWLDLTVGPGRIVRAELPGGAVAFAGGRLVADYDPFAARLAIERFALDLGGPTLEATGSVEQLHLDPGLGASPVPLLIAAEAVARNVPAAELDRLWPLDAARGGREWVTENIQEGLVEEAQAEVRIN